MTLGTKEWAPNNENCIEGCENDCRYGYCKKNAIRFGRRTKENWHEMKPNARSQQPVKYKEGGIMFPTTHDLHIRHLDWWGIFLLQLLAKGNDVLIVSKPEFAAIEWICEKCIMYKHQIEFRFTIGSIDDHVLKFWEPGAPGIKERFRALTYAFDHGYKTSVSMEPLLDKDPTSLITLVRPWVTETIWIGTMNHMHQSDFAENEMQWYDRMLEINAKENMQKIWEANQNNKQIRWKDSVQKLLGISQTGELIKRRTACGYI